MPRKVKADNEKFMKCQVKKLDIEKWYEGLRIHRDPSSEYIFNWVKENAQMYRDQWFNSACSYCPKWETCGWKAVEQCQEEQDAMKEIMTNIFRNQYDTQKTVGDHKTGCKKNTIHYFLANIENKKVVLKLNKEGGNFDDLMNTINESYQCVSVILGIPFLIKQSEQNNKIIIKYIKDNSWI
jgi:hypothetical protein